MRLAYRGVAKAELARQNRDVVVSALREVENASGTEAKLAAYERIIRVLVADYMVRHNG